MDTLIDKLQSENIRPRHTDVGTQKIKCPECQGPNGSHKQSDNPLSFTVNADGSAVWHCHHCQYTGNWFPKDNNYRFANPQPKKIYTVPSPKPTADNNSLLTFMKGRGISAAVVEEYKLYQQDGWFCFPYYDEQGELVNVKSRSRDKKFKQEADAKSILYNYDNCHKLEEIIWVEGEMDVLSLAEIGYKNATTLPNGAPKEFKGDDNDKRFVALQNCPLDVKKVIIFTDNDPSGKALHKEILHRFGKDICWYVRLPQGVKDANELLMKQGPIALKEAVEAAVPYPIDGLYTARDYYHTIQEIYDGKYERPIEFGIHNLDKIYKIMPGTFHLWTGVPNHGKSMFLDFCLIHLARNHGHKFAIFSPEHSTQMHIRRLLQMVVQKSFDEGFNNRMTKQEMNDALAWIYKHFYFIETRNAVPSAELILNIAKSACQKFGFNALVIDPYNEVDASRKGNQREDEHIRDFISMCKRFGRLHNCTVFVVAHPTKQQKNNQGTFDPPTAYDVAGAAHWHNQSDAVITVHRDFEQNSTSVLTRKIREQGLYGEIGEAEFVYNISKRTYEERRYDAPLTSRYDFD